MLTILIIAYANSVCQYPLRKYFSEFAVCILYSVFQAKSRGLLINKPRLILCIELLLRIILVVIYKLIEKLRNFNVHILIAELASAHSLVTAAAVFEHKTAYIDV